MSELLRQHRRANLYRQSGYLRALSILSDVETASLRTFVHEQADNEVDASQKLYGLYDREPTLLHPLVTHPKLVSELSPLLGPNIVFVKNRHNHATINARAGTKRDARMHRDILQPTRGLLTAIVYLEESTIDNGCTNVIPGSHKFDYVGAPQANGGGTWMDEHAEFEGLEDQAVPVPMPAGSVLLFDGTLFHSIGQNNTSGTRTSITLGYRSVDELQAKTNNMTELVIAGSHIYRGNDQ